jgi:hypothetical protein
MDLVCEVHVHRIRIVLVQERKQNVIGIALDPNRKSVYNIFIMNIFYRINMSLPSRDSVTHMSNGSIPSFRSSIFSSIPSSPYSNTPSLLNIDDLNITPQEYPFPIGEGVAYQIHNVFENIQENLDKINKLMGGVLSIEPLNLSKEQFSHSIYSSFEQYLDKNKNGNSQQQQQQQITDIVKKLYTSNLLSNPEVCNNIFTWNQFVLRQPESFQTHYVECFIQDTYNAYDTGTERISCPKGIYERMLYNIGDACIMYCTENKKKRRRTKKRRDSQHGGKPPFSSCDNPLYRRLIVLMKKMVPDLNELTKEWSNIFNKECAKQMTPDELKRNFIDYMVRKYAQYGIHNQEAKIETRANELEEAQIFQNKEFGGCYRTMKKRRSRKKNIN